MRRTIRDFLCKAAIPAALVILAGCSSRLALDAGGAPPADSRLGAPPAVPDDAADLWIQLLEDAGDDSAAIDCARERIRLAADEFSVSGSAAGAPALFAALQGYLLAGSGADSSKAASVEERLLAGHPESEEVFDLAASEFYRRLYPVWRNDTLKVEILTELMDKYSVTSWRRRMYQYLTHSLSELADVDRLEEALSNWRKETPSDYLPFSASAFYLLEHEKDPARALELSEQAALLVKTAEKPPHFPPMEWGLEERAAPMNVAAVRGRALLATGNHQEAAKILMKALGSSKTGVDDENTPARIFLLLAKCRLAAGDEPGAADWCVKALAAGDSRNRYCPEADSLLRAAANLVEAPDSDILRFSRMRLNYRGATFSDVSASYGLEGVSGRRVAWGDYDGDGYQDLLLDGCRLFRNERGRRFRDVTGATGLGECRGSGGLWGDLDADGDLDFVTMDPEAAWLNDDGVFSRVTSEGALADNGVKTEGMGLGDVDGDGYLDLYLADYEVWKTTGSLPEHDQFFLGGPGGRFREATVEAALVPADLEPRAGRGVNMGDYDNDGDLDIFVSNYRLQDNFLWVNDGAGVFENRAEAAGVAGIEIDGWRGHTIGSEWGDWDNDGDLDLVTANLAHPRYIDFSNKTRLYRNSGPPGWVFTDHRADAGIRFEETHSEPGWGDFDNDGFLDLYLNDVYEGRRSFLYMQNGDGTFRENTYLAGARHFNGWGCAFADIDRDGDLDILAAGGTVQLFRNDTGRKGHWLVVELSTVSGHSEAIGTRLTLSGGVSTLIREVEGGKGTTNQHSLAAHFGLGDGTGPFTLEVRFPSGVVRTLEIIEVDRYVSVSE